MKWDDFSAKLGISGKIRKATISGGPAYTRTTEKRDIHGPMDASFVSDVRRQDEFSQDGIGGWLEVEADLSKNVKVAFKALIGDGHYRVGANVQYRFK